MQQAPEILLAKSKREGRILSLEQHLLDTEQAAVLIFRVDGRWGRNWCRFFGLRNREIQEKFLLNLRIAALFHDLGKANEDFYRAVTHAAFVQQSLRHEHISALLLHLPRYVVGSHIMRHLTWKSLPRPCCLTTSKLLVMASGNGVSRAGAASSIFSCSMRK